MYVILLTLFFQSFKDIDESKKPYADEKHDFMYLNTIGCYFLNSYTIIIAFITVIIYFCITTTATTTITITTAITVTTTIVIIILLAGA